MAVPAVRERLETSARFEKASNPSLLLSRYLRHANDPQARKQLLETAMGAAGEARTIYSKAFERWKRALDSDASCHTETVSTYGRVIVGLGSQSVLETGIALHQVYGVPLLPGSALKGLASHYCDGVYGPQQHGFHKRPEDAKIESERENEDGVESWAYHQVIFGSRGQAGHITFHDAWIDPSSLLEGSGLRLDVMTPHHSPYYRLADEADKGESTIEIPAPSDFDAPIPVSYLSVSGEFLLALSCDDNSPRGQAWLELTMLLLRESLKNWGVGGKTSSGYGRLSELKKGPKRYDRGDGPLRVVRELDHKNRTKYRADDGHLGHIPGEPPDGKPGDVYEVWVDQRADHSYTFSLEEPKKSK